MTAEELNNLGVRQWSDISNNYTKPDLLLGNGFSISFSTKFQYNSLFENFILKCPPRFQTLFKSFETTNFELIMEYLTHARKVNSILGLDTQLIQETIDYLKNGLIQTINEIHPKSSEIDWDRLSRITNQLRYFEDIYSTNYDLFLYHIIMNSNDLHKNDSSYSPYQDYFWGSDSPEFKKFMNYQSYKVYKHVYYLHGSLFIFKKNIYDLKIIKKGKVELIDIISREISNDKLPLFISEGKASDKLEAIERSNYLSFCLESFKSTNNPLLIHGNSMADVDRHLLSAIQSKPRDLIISLYPVGKSEVQINKEKIDLVAKFNNFNKTIEFIDSRSIFQ